MTDGQRTRLLIRISEVLAHEFYGSIADLLKLGETWNRRIGWDDEWLLALAKRNGIDIG